MKTTTTNARAVLYCRSSKDRADVSIDVQRRELAELAHARGYIVLEEFTDSVESGKDDDRPGFQRLHQALYDRARTWSVILMLDTGRLGRGDVAYWFEEKDCKPRGVSVVYKSLPPEIDEPERMLMKGVFRGVDHWWSLQAKRKALAGMRENVRNGYRAGGRPPMGYRLEHVAIGPMRDGKPVLKSRLVPSDQAPAIAAYLRDRAAGVPRFRARAKNGITAPVTTLISVERNALTYAGHTVWNMMNEPGRGQDRYRPRSEWEVKRETHLPLISDPEADAILAMAHRPTRAVTRPTRHDYLLAGLLRSPAGAVWHGDRAEFYRIGKGRRLAMRRVDRTVLDALVEDLAGDRLLNIVLEHVRARAAARKDGKPLAGMRRRLEELNRKIRRLADLAADSEAAAPLLRTITEVEKERAGVELELELALRETSTARTLRAIGEKEVRQALRGLATDLEESKDVAGLRDVVMKLLERVDLDPAEPAHLVLRYRLPALGGFELASPQDTEFNPIQRRVKLAA